MSTCPSVPVSSPGTFPDRPLGASSSWQCLLRCVTPPTQLPAPSADVTKYNNSGQALGMEADEMSILDLLKSWVDS